MLSVVFRDAFRLGQAERLAVGRDEGKGARATLDLANRIEILLELLLILLPQSLLPQSLPQEPS